MLLRRSQSLACLAGLRSAAGLASSSRSGLVSSASACTTASTTTKTTTCTTPAKRVCLLAQRSTTSTAQTPDREKKEKEKKEITIRDARRADADFLGRVMLQASRSHLDEGVYDIYFPTFSDDERLALLADMAACSPDAGSVCCWDGFLVAEVNGTPAAALSGYGSDTKSTQGYLDTMWDALRERGWTRDEFERMLEKREAIQSVTTKDPRPLWVVDWVTTLPEFRKLGLSSKLLREVLQRGKERGYKLTEVSVFLDNDPAILAYKKAGFEEYQSITSPVWQRYIKCPGIMRLIRPLDDTLNPTAATAATAAARHPTSQSRI